MTSSIFQRVQEIANGFHLDPLVTVELLDFGYEVASEAYARGCADQHERTKVTAVDVARSMVALTSIHAAYKIAAAIDKMEMKDV